MGEQKTESGRVEEDEGSVVTTSIVKPKNRTIKMKSWNDTIQIYNPDGIEFIVMSYEQLTVRAGFISRTTICARKEKIQVDDISNDSFVYVNYIGQEFHG